MEVYRAAKEGDGESIENEMRRLRRFSEFAMHGPFIEELGFGGKEAHMLAMEFPRLLEHVLMRAMKDKKQQPRSRRSKQEANSAQ